MEGEKISNLEVQSGDLLKKINEALAFLGSDSKWKMMPRVLEGYAPLKDKKVVMVDDARAVLECYAPHLIVATDGNAAFIEYKGQTLEELLKQIMEQVPNIVVMDYHLSGHLKGTRVIQALKELEFSGDAVGFSSDTNTKRDFMNAGAKGVVEKTGYAPEESVVELASLISKEE